jgi:hypothetical protein
VAREAQTTTADGLEGRRMRLVVLDDEGDRRARVDPEDDRLNRRPREVDTMARSCPRIMRFM